MKNHHAEICELVTHELPLTLTHWAKNLGWVRIERTLRRIRPLTERLNHSAITLAPILMSQNGIWAYIESQLTTQKIWLENRLARMPNADRNFVTHEQKFRMSANRTHALIEPGPKPDALTTRPSPFDSSWCPSLCWNRYIGADPPQSKYELLRLYYNTGINMMLSHIGSSSRLDRHCRQWPFHHTSRYVHSPQRRDTPFFLF